MTHGSEDARGPRAIAVIVAPVNRSSNRGMMAMPM